MERFELMIVENEKEMAKKVKGILSGAEDIQSMASPSSRLRALRQLCEEHPDVMLLNVIPEDAMTADGSVLNVADKYQMGVRLALVNGDAAIQSLKDGTRYFLVKPIPADFLSDMELAMEQEEEQMRQQDDTDKMIAGMCLRIGIPAHIQGYQFICQAIRMVMDDGEVINRITKELYPGVARQYKTTASKVERSIRHAISVLWNKDRIDDINALFGFPVCKKEKKPTNGEFIALMAGRCKGEMKDS